MIQQLALVCPECGSSSYVSNGQRKRKDGLATQLFKCRECGYRFSENYKRSVGITYPSIHYALEQECEKMDTTTEQKSVAGDMKDVNGKIIEFLFKLEKQGRAPATRRLASSCLRMLEKRGANLADPETVKEVLAKQSNTETAHNNKPWSTSRKRNMINSYTMFLRFQGKAWEKPTNRVTRKIPFIPTEQEIDDLIAASPSPLAAFLQLLKETAMRRGEAIRIPWKDVDLERRIILCNHPEKGSNPRIFSDLSGKLLSMLNALPKENEMLFGTATENQLKNILCRTRKRLAYRMGNPRLEEIHMHTFRHWKATMLYHYKPDLLIVAEFLGHKDLENTRMYVSLEKNLFKNLPNDQFICKIALNTTECCDLINVGFEYITGTFEDGGKIFRKRK
jgi:integrase